jgi:hypothetical protein
MALADTRAVRRPMFLVPHGMFTGSLCVLFPVDCYICEYDDAFQRRILEVGGFFIVSPSLLG